jgi:hypothetical protein
MKFRGSPQYHFTRCGVSPLVAFPSTSTPTSTFPRPLPKSHTNLRTTEKNVIIHDSYRAISSSMTTTYSSPPDPQTTTAAPPGLINNNGGGDGAGSDYGSDFTPDEEELLDALLVRATATATATGTASIAATGAETGTGLTGLATFPEEGRQEAVRPHAGVADIEDYDRIFRSSSAPKVLGRGLQAFEQHQQPSGIAAGGQSSAFYYNLRNTLLFYSSATPKVGKLTFF